MKLSQVFEYRTKTKRPPKTLWYDNYNMWAHDIILRFPDAEPIEFEDEEVIAIDSQRQCYGVWNKKQHKGVTFNNPRPLKLVNKKIK